MKIYGTWGIRGSKDVRGSVDMGNQEQGGYSMWGPGGVGVWGSCQDFGCFIALKPVFR